MSSPLVLGLDFGGSKIAVGVAAPGVAPLATATIGVSCDVASTQRSERSVGLKSAKAKTSFPVVVSVGCSTS